IFLLVGIELIDFFTGPEIASYVFYLIPIVFFSWFFGERTGIALSLLSAVVTDLTDIATGLHYSHPALMVWSMVVRAAIFSIAAVALSRLRRELFRQKEDNERLLRAYEEIKKLSQVKSEFTAMVSHELRTPLTAILESVNMVVDGSAGPISAEQENYLDITQRNVKRLARLINEVLDFSKLEAGGKKPALAENDLNELIAQAVKLYQPLAEKKGLELSRQLSPDLRRFKFDGDGITQVIENMLNNALKFTAHGRVLVTTRPEKGCVAVCVEDSGCGIDQDDIVKLFTPFEQLGRKEGRCFEGSGLGLVISKMIVEQHRGRIWVESEPGKGTKVCFTLPLN
ncbi:MAG TPA: HAMP domain-containing sensor histidine kinase, partial [Candidatus Omnitrophota bacterium]|nr:HAMP domain-containing sensor histidine kinase [Candidatus Omnitrophota bacterium]